MNAATRADQALAITGNAGTLSVSSQRTLKGDRLFVRIVNAEATAVDLTLTLTNFPASPSVTSWTLASAVPNGGNSFANQSAVEPVEAAITLKSGGVYTVPALSFTVLGFVAA